MLLNASYSPGFLRESCDGTYPVLVSALLPTIDLTLSRPFSAFPLRRGVLVFDRKMTLFIPGIV